jgi:hypothetical protein
VQLVNSHKEKMTRSKSQVSSGTSKTKTPADELLPDWAEAEIKTVNFAEPESVLRAGYFLDINENDYKVDIQIYEALPDGRTIVEGLDVPKNIKITDFLKGFVYEFKIKVFKGNLSQKLSEILKSKYDLDMDAIYRFELEELQEMDVESDSPSTSSAMAEEQSEEEDHE